MQVDAPRLAGLVDDRADQRRALAGQPCFRAHRDEASRAVLDDGGEPAPRVGLEVPDPALAEEQLERRVHAGRPIVRRGGQRSVAVRLDEVGDRPGALDRHGLACEAGGQAVLHLCDLGPRAFDRLALAGGHPGLDQGLGRAVERGDRERQPRLRVEQRLLVDPCLIDPLRTHLDEVIGARRAGVNTRMPQSPLPNLRYTAERSVTIARRRQLEGEA